MADTEIILTWSCHHFLFLYCHHWIAPPAYYIVHCCTIFHLRSGLWNVKYRYPKDNTEIINNLPLRPLPLRVDDDENRLFTSDRPPVHKPCCRHATWFTFYSSYFSPSSCTMWNMVVIFVFQYFIIGCFLALNFGSKITKTLDFLLKYLLSVLKIILTFPKYIRILKITIENVHCEILPKSFFYPMFLGPSFSVPP